MAINGLGLSGLDGTSGSSSSPNVKKKDTIGQNEFLTLLVTQLKNQDPLDPSNPEEFAVNLAQFTQVEQLTQINKKLDSSSNGSDIGNLTSYLGKDVTLDSDVAHVTGHDGGILKLDLPADASQVAVQLLDADGQVVEEHVTGPMTAGKKSINLSNLETESGDYTVKVVAVGSAGTQLNAKVRMGGVVSGIIPGPEPMLLVNGREVSPADIKEVGLAEN